MLVHKVVSLSAWNVDEKNKGNAWPQITFVLCENDQNTIQAKFVRISTKTPLNSQRRGPVSKLQAKFVRMQRVWLKQKHLAILVYVEGWEGTKESSDFEGWRMYVQRRCNPVLSTVFGLHQMLGWTCLFCFGLSFFSASMLKQSPRTKRLRTASGTPTSRSSLFDRGMWPCGKSN